MPFRVDRSPKLGAKTPPMYSPRIDGGGVLASRSIPPSPLSKGLDGPAGSISLPSVDYDDVFGGPPRFGTTMFAAQDSHGPSAALDRSVARTPSFRSPALPVFELPVFGDDAFSNSNMTRPASVAYDDIFREEVHAPDVYTASSIQGNFPRSKASSRSGSRRMSPIHPAVSLPDQLLHEDILAAANTGVFSKARSSVGQKEGRTSFSSPSFDEGRSKPLDPVFMMVRNDTVGSSLPASPPHSGNWGQVKRFTTSKSVHNLGSVPTCGEVDDVFGGFPQRKYPPVFQPVNHETSKSPRIPSGSTRGAAEKKVPRSPLRVQSSEPYGGLSSTLSSSSSSDGERDLQGDFFEIRMDKQSHAAPEKTEAAANRTWVTLNDLKQSAQSTPKLASARPPTVPASVSGGTMKHKSWKDWTSNLSQVPPVHSSSPGVAQDTTVALGTGPTAKTETNNITSMTQQDKAEIESLSLQQPENNQAVQLPRGNFTVFSPLRTALKAKPLVEAIQLEERELHAMLNNAWKDNEKRERKKNSAARRIEDFSGVVDLRMQNFGKEGTKQPNIVPNTFLNVQGVESVDDKQAGLQWQSWRKHTCEGKMDTKESNKIDSAHKIKQINAPDHNDPAITEDRAGNCEKSNRLSEHEDFFDPEEIVKVVTEEMPANGRIQEADRLGSKADLDTKSSMQVAADGAEIVRNEKSIKGPKDENEVSSDRSSRASTFQDFGQYSEQQEVSLSEGMEETDSLIGLDASLAGFQDIEGESVERRKARWVRHLRAKQRAARVLEEMQQRDAEVLRQQLEKQQLAENADRQIKRWATGKEGNLRALLSNLQHVLWPESGWKPISLTDLIEGPDVKKAYRKATLFVHPDKLQQKGASLQQKYIAERVFDILQEAWKTFNLQELF